MGFASDVEVASVLDCDNYAAVLMNGAFAAA